MSPAKSVLGFVAVLVFLAGPARADEVAEADEKLLRDAKVGTDGPALVAFFKGRTLTDADRQKLEQLVRHLGSDSFEQREQATKELIRRGTVALPFLRRAQNDPDVEVSRRVEQCLSEIQSGPGAALPAAAARLLARRQPDGAVAALFHYLPFADDEAVEEEVLASLVALAAKGGKPDAVLIEGLAGSAAVQRGAAAYVLGQHADKEQRAAVPKLLADADGKVRLRAAQGLFAGQDKAAVPALIDFVADGPADLVWVAEDLLLRLAGEQPPELPANDGSKKARQQQRDAWAAWWKDHGDKTDLAKAKLREPYLGLTVIAHHDSGQVWECGRDGKPRWKIDGLQGPIDARVVVGNRVLVAEFTGHRVTERDFKGNVLWEHKINGPHVCQRLPNGNTFIVTVNDLVEVARDGKVVYSHKIEGGKLIYGAQKLRDGIIVAMLGDGSAVEVEAATGKKLKTTPVASNGAYWVEKLPDGHYLAADYFQNKVLERDAAGKVVWELAVPNAYHATRLPNGNTLVSSHAGKKVLEVDKAGKTVFEVSADSPVYRVHRR